MRRVFDPPVKGKEAVSLVLSLVQVRNSVSQYTLNFHILATESEWNECGLQGVLLKGLSEEIKNELAARNKSSSLEELIRLATWLDNRLRERRRERAKRQRVNLNPDPLHQCLQSPLPSPASHRL